MKKAVFQIILITVLAIGPSLAQAAPILFWHHQEGIPAQFLQTITREFNEANGTAIKLETGMDIRAALLSSRGKSADLVLFPSDLGSLQRELRLSQIPDGLPGGKTFGIPILSGNHLLLFYNKTLISKPAASWDELKNQARELASRGIKPIGWPVDEPYFFLYFLQTLGGELTNAKGQFQLDTPAMKSALGFYKTTTEQGLLPVACDIECATSRFYRGEFAYAISGEWGIPNARAALGKSMGVAPLPSILGKPHRGYGALTTLIFPNDSIHGPKGPTLRRFATFLTSPKIQERWFQEASRIPADPAILAKLLNTKEDLPPETRITLTEAQKATPLPDSSKLHLVWQVMKKGLRLLLNGKLDAEQTSKYMQQSIKIQEGP